MKRYKYVVAATCLLLSAAGFLGLYATSQPKEKSNQQAENEKNNEQIVKESEEIILGSNQFELDEDSETEKLEEENLLAEADQKVDIEEEQEEVAEAESEEQEAPVGTITPEVLHFSPENGLKWPVDGTVLLDYSMDATIFFPTLQQYQYNPAMIIAAKVNDKVYSMAKGKITDISTNEETGCTVTQDIGDGYTAVYGQLKELNFDIGDMVESGQVVGYVNEPTKYYSTEGSNVYFQVLKDGVPVDPEEILP